MKVTETSLPGVIVFEPAVYRDSRGFFSESFNEERFGAIGVQLRFRQDNHSHSLHHVLRGLHYQLRRPQGKLVSCLNGEIFDVAVDIRRHSPTFGRWTGIVLRGDEPRSLWIPPGFAHGFCVLSSSADVVYKCTDVYDPEDDRGILWSDPAIGIRWPIASPLLSARDERHRGLSADRDDLPSYS
ncbi:MAG: rfbC [Gemmatimonadetes bacterium]|nr:rfbC [Gemmatimonadota bacterium]